MNHHAISNRQLLYASLNYDKKLLFNKDGGIVVVEITGTCVVVMLPAKLLTIRSRSHRQVWIDCYSGINVDFLVLY